MLNRGNCRRDLFAPEGAAAAFQACLFEAADRFSWRLHAFVIMRNHFHLALETPEPNLCEGMRWLQATWAVRFNRFHGEAGRPFQGRYKALHVEPGQVLAQVAHYIHLNPVRAKVVTVERLIDFPWSSLRHFLAPKRPAALEAGTILGESGGLPDSPEGWRRYLAYLDVVAEEEVKLRDEKFGRLSRGWAIGSPEFKQGLKKELLTQGAGRSARFELLGADPEARREVRAHLWEETLTVVANELGVELGALPEQRSAPETVLLAAVTKVTTSVTNAWLAARLLMGEPASVSQYVRRFRMGGGAEKADFKRALARGA